MASRPHLAALKNLTDKITVTGVYARDSHKTKAIAEMHGYHAFSTLEEIAQCNKTEAVIVITPPNSRHKIIDKMSAAGKHILTEKPVERSYAAAVELVEMCETRDVLLAVVLQHRFRAGAQRLTEVFSSGELGELALVRAEVPWWRDQSYYDAAGRGTYQQDGGGVLITQAIHVIDLMLAITGPVAQVQALSATTKLHDIETEDFATCGIIFKSGIPGSIVATTSSYPGGVEKLTLDGTLGSATLEAGKLVITWRDGKTEQVGEVTGTGGGSDPMDFPCDWHQSLIEDFANSIANNRPPRVTGRDALRVQKLIDAIKISSDQGRLVSLDEIT
ncbi:MAG: Gfo/Idh/MocA family oxidoreductase [Pseudomonadales bacterium]|nr:Gfo/Idh/MocA family oxidoreductase [Pseudomonadales bacterium]NRA18757.1 Gfo/Idh/MocA family oxidoreductase [Oceanospirillaceae bacterium]